MSEAKYKRVLLKLSGEALAGENKTGVNAETIGKICDKIKEVTEMGVEVGIVVGGGNFWRGRNGHQMERATADYMGMLATAMNGLALQDALEARGVNSRVQTAIEMREIAEPFIIRKAEKHLGRGRVVIFACGTGHPYFTTDTAAVLRATEINADIILLGKAIDAVYSADPKLDANAERYAEDTAAASGLRRPPVLYICQQRLMVRRTRCSMLRRLMNNSSAHLFHYCCVTIQVMIYYNTNTPTTSSACWLPC